MKKVLSLLSAILLLIFLSACGETDEQKLKRLREETERANEMAGLAEENYNDFKERLENLDKANEYLESFN